MLSVKELTETMSISRISYVMNVPRISIYYRKKDHTGKRKSRISNYIEEQVFRIAAERTTYGYRSIWALLRNSGIHVNIKTVRRIIRKKNLSLPSAKHKDRIRKRDLTKPENINRLWETDIHFISTSREGMIYLISIKDCFSKKWISYEISRSCTAKDCIRTLEKAYSARFPDIKKKDLVLRTDNGPQYISGEFKETVKFLGIRSEYIQKHTPEDNGDIESFHNSLKTDYIWVNDIETFQDAGNLIEYAFIDYNTIRPYSSVN